jgi:uncharacterized iron-regulated protein
MMIRAFHAFALLAFMLTTAARADQSLGDWSLAIVDGATGDTISADGLRDRIRAADIVLLGEIHDNGAHHMAQGLALSWMFEAGPGTVVLEMLDRDQQAAVDAFDGTAADFGPTMSWDTRGWPSADLYLPVFRAMIDAGARIVASDLPRRDLRSLYGDGADALPAEVRAVHDLLEPMPPDVLAEMTEIQFASHCELMPRDKMAGMVTVQRARDAALAESVVAAHRAGHGPVALIAGTGHVRHDHGTGLLVRRAAPDASVLAIGLTEAVGGDVSVSADRLGRFDVLWMTPAMERPDPCDSLREKLTGQ